MINDFLKLLEVWRRDKFAVHSRYVYRIPQCQCLFARRGLVTNEKMWPEAIQGPRQGSIISLGREGWQRWRIDVPPRRLREGRLWKPPVSRWYAYALNTDGCRVVSGMCQEAWIDFDISEIMFMVNFYRLLCTINFTRSSVEWHSCRKQDFPELGLGGYIQGTV